MQHGLAGRREIVRASYRIHTQAFVATLPELCNSAAQDIYRRERCVKQVAADENKVYFFFQALVQGTLKSKNRHLLELRVVAP